MSRKKIITLSFDLEQVCNDVLAKCNLISENIREAGLEDIRANVQEPDNPETSSIINRSVTEAFGRVKVAAQRYLTVGRDTDTNVLERLVIPGSVIYPQVQKTHNGYPVWNYTSSGTSIEVYAVTTESGGTTTTVYKKVSNDEEVTVQDSSALSEVMVNDTSQGPTEMTFETVTLTLQIPNFNLSVTDHLKSSIHKYVVDYVMGRFLQDQVADKAAEYRDEAENVDLANIIRDLNARERYTMRKPNFM